MWSSVTSEPYLCFTLHYIGKEWNLQSTCLHCLFLPEDHTGDNLAEALKETLTEWQLDENKLICITTDSGSNIVCAASSRLMWTRLSYLDHNLHLAVINSTNDDPRVHRPLGLCRKIVTSFSHIWKKKCDLAKAQSDLDLTPHSLVADCATHWGSRQKIVSRILEQESSIQQVLSADRKATRLIPTWQDLKVLESMQAALSPLADFTDMLSGEERVTVSTIKPVCIF